MTLSELRQKFKSLSGRADLVNTDGSDNGADFFIQEGSRFLDRWAEIGESEATVFRPVHKDSYYVTVDGCRAVREVWLYAGGRTYKLERANKLQLRAFFPQTLINHSTGIPGLYVPVNMRKGEDSTSLTGFLNHVSFKGDEYNGILFPPSSLEGTLEITGLFYSLSLTEDSHENYWSIKHPMLLVWAALYHLEIGYRNTEGANDWLRAITTTMDGIEKDHVEEVSNDLKQLGGKEHERQDF